MRFSPTKAIEAREAAGFSRRTAAKRAGVSRQGLYNLEQGESTPTLRTLALLADAYGCDLGDFLTTDQAPTDASQARTVGARVNGD